MTLKHILAVAFPFIVAVPAAAQSVEFVQAPTYSFAIRHARGAALSSQPDTQHLKLSFSSSQKDTWHTVMIVSAVVGIVGLADGDSSLVVLGGAGVLLSLFETGGSSFRFRPFRSGVELLKTGPFSMGVNSFGPIGLAPGVKSSRPSPYAQWTFKF